ncbi:MAG: response regulator [Desulfatirhabdiaceae bacterium]|jgi:DNA-binding NtrC family response regulator|nr:response regulator [Desulfatirhabdiaceae bacterium]
MSLANILLVDDEVPFVETMTKRLKKRGFEILSAHSGLDALDQLSRNHSIEVVILDVKMPGMDGIQTLEQIKHKFPITEVIMLTGHATVESAIDGMRLGAFDYLMKPCEMEQLVSKVEGAAMRRRSHEEKIIQARMKEITSRMA